MSRSKFPTSEGLLIQFTQLAQWKTKLNTKCYKALAEECLQQNRLLSEKDNGYKVFRGQQLTEFVLNYKP